MNLALIAILTCGQLTLAVSGSDKVVRKPVVKSAVIPKAVEERLLIRQVIGVLGQSGGTLWQKFGPPNSSSNGCRVWRGSANPEDITPDVKASLNPITTKVEAVTLNWLTSHPSALTAGELIDQCFPGIEGDVHRRVGKDQRWIFQRREFHLLYLGTKANQSIELRLISTQNPISRQPGEDPETGAKIEKVVKATSFDWRQARIYSLDVHQWGQGVIAQKGIAGLFWEILD